MGMLDPTATSLPRDAATAEKDTGQMLQTLVLKQMLMASGAFKGGDSAGSSLHAEMFAEALADAVTKSGLNLTGNAPKVSPPDRAGPPRAPSPIPESILAGAGHLTSAFGLRTDPLDGHLASHRGVDVGAPEGSSILSAGDGVVKRAGVRGGYGEALEIDHGGGVTTLYGHASELLVKEGDHVAKGQPIAKVGHTGRATGDHVHFEVRRDGRAVDPTRALKAYAVRADNPFSKEP